MILAQTLSFCGVAREGAADVLLGYKGDTCLREQEWVLVAVLKIKHPRNTVEASTENKFYLIDGQR